MTVIIKLESFYLDAWSLQMTFCVIYDIKFLVAVKLYCGSNLLTRPVQHLDY
jgi:hypothetical protein